MAKDAQVLSTGGELTLTIELHGTIISATLVQPVAACKPLYVVVVSTAFVAYKAHCPVARRGLNKLMLVLA